MLALSNAVAMMSTVVAEGPTRNDLYNVPVIKSIHVVSIGFLPSWRRLYVCHATLALCPVFLPQHKFKKEKERETFTIKKFLVKQRETGHEGNAHTPHYSDSKKGCGTCGEFITLALGVRGLTVPCQTLLVVKSTVC